MDKTSLTSNFQLTIKVMFITAIFLLIFSVLIRVWIMHQHSSLIYSPATSPSSEIAVILGAGLRRDGKPTRVLQDRIEAGIKLFEAGKINKMLMSGSQTIAGYDEVNSMKEYAVMRGIPSNVILLDGRGFSTQKTCENIFSFKIDEVILISQKFHLPRALYFCSSLGIKSIGVYADMPGYRTSTLALWNLREIPATFVAFIQNLIKMK